MELILTACALPSPAGHLSNLSSAFLLAMFSLGWYQLPVPVLLLFAQVVVFCLD